MMQKIQSNVSSIEGSKWQSDTNNLNVEQKAVFRTETPQINAPSISPKGFAYVMQPGNGNSQLFQIDIQNGTELLKDLTVPLLTTNEYGVMCGVYNNHAIVATAQQNKQNVGETRMTVVDLTQNKELFKPVVVPKGNTVYDVEIGSFNEGSPVWGYGIEVNSSNYYYDVSQTTVHLFPLDTQFQQKKIVLDFYSPVQNGGTAISTFVDNNVLALMVYNKELKTYILYLDLVHGIIKEQYEVPSDAMKTDGGCTGLAYVKGNRNFSLAAMNAKGKVYVGPALNSKNFVLEAEMHENFEKAGMYQALIHVGNGIFAFYSETRNPYKATERFVGFYDMNQKKHLADAYVEITGNSDFHMSRLEMLESGKLALTLVSRNVSDSNSPTHAYVYQLDVPAN